MNDDKNALRVGITVLASVVIFAALLIRVGRLSDFLKDRNQVQVVFEDAGGLPKGAPVLYQGVQIGTVAAVTVFPATEPVGAAGGEAKVPAGGRNWVLVTLDIEQSPLYPISYADQMVIRVPLAMGDPDLRITPTVGGSPYVENGPPVVGVSGGDIIAAINSAMQEIQATLGETLGPDQRLQLRETLSRAHSFLGDAQKSLAKVDAAIPEMTGKLGATLDQAAVAIKSLDSTVKETLAVATATAGDAGKTIRHIDEIVTEAGPKLTATLTRADGVLASSDKLIIQVQEDVKGVSTRANSALEEIGALAKDTRQPLATVLTNAGAATQELRTAVVGAGKATEELRAILAENRAALRHAASQIEETAGNLNAAATDVRRHPWKLIRKPSAKEVVSTDLATAGDQAAAAASDLQEAMARLDAILAKRDTLLENEVNAVEGAAKALRDSLKEVDALQKRIDDAR